MSLDPTLGRDLLARNCAGTAAALGSLRGELDAHDTTSQSALQLISDHSGIKCNWPLLATVFVYMAHSLTTNWREEI